MDLRLLTAFVALADEGHFGRTARRLYMSPSALSQQIKSLEASWGVSLFARGARGAVLTPEGVRLLEGARRMVAGAASYREEVDEVADGSVGTVRLGFVDQVLGEVVVGLLRSLRREVPEVRVVARSHRTGEDALQRLRTGWHDAVVVMDAPDEGLARVTLASVPYVVAVDPDHPLSAQDAVAWSAVADRLDEMSVPASPDRGASASAGGDGRPLGSEPVGPGRIADALLEVVQRGRPALVTASEARRFRVPDVSYCIVTGEGAPRASIDLVWRPEGVTPMLAGVVDVARRHAPR